MAEDTYFMDGEHFYRRKGGNKIEPLKGFRALQPGAQRRHPLLVLELRDLKMSGDGKWILFCGPDGRVYTARALRKDHTFLEPQMPDRCIVQPIIGSARNGNKKASKKRRRPR